MKAHLEPGNYVVAVSGGVDSVVLLHLVRQLPEVRFVVAHFDHGIRPESAEDRRFVQELAALFGIPFVYDEGRLGNGASEATAREARYAFLYKVREASLADAIVTAHHKDDLLETAIINIVRGTGRKGLAGMRSTDIVRRPLLGVTKAEIAAYAKQQGLTWREDTTNADTAFLRNHIRHNTLPRINEADQARLIEIIRHTESLNADIDALIKEFLSLHVADGTLDVRIFRTLPHVVAREIMAGWLRNNKITTFDKKMLERLTHAAKIHKTGREVQINKSVALRVYDSHLALIPRER